MQLDDALEVLVLMAQERDPASTGPRRGGWAGSSPSSPSASLTRATRWPWASGCRSAESRSTGSHEGIRGYGSRLASGPPRIVTSMLLPAGCSWAATSTAPT
jgi:hypothetical protein